MDEKQHVTQTPVASTDPVTPTTPPGCLVIGFVNLVISGPIYMCLFYLVIEALALCLCCETMTERLLFLMAAFGPLSVLPPLTSSKLLNTLHIHPSQFVGLVVLLIYGLRKWLYRDPMYYGSLTSEERNEAVTSTTFLVYLLACSVLINEVKWTQAYFDSQWSTSTNNSTDSSRGVRFLLKRAIKKSMVLLFFESFPSPVIWLAAFSPVALRSGGWDKYMHATFMLVWIVVSCILVPILLSSDECRSYQLELSEDENYHPLQWNDKKSLGFYARDEVKRDCCCCAKQRHVTSNV